MAAENHRLRIYLSVFSIVLAIGVLGFMLLEGLSFADAVYFVFVTMTTVGYGDINPASMGGKLLALLLVVAGIGTFMGVINALTDGLLDKKEKRSRESKLHILINSFFSRFGAELLARLSRFDANRASLQAQFQSDRFCATTSLSDVFIKRLKEPRFEMDAGKGDLQGLKAFLTDHDDYLMRLLENPHLMEHGRFTDALMAVSHLEDELNYRTDLSALPASDIRHLTGDLERACRRLFSQWLDYLGRLQRDYPYLYSLALRTNPFAENVSVIVNT